MHFSLLDCSGTKLRVFKYQQYMIVGKKRLLLINILFTFIYVTIVENDFHYL